MFQFNRPLESNGIKLKADRLYKRFGDGGLILGCVSWCVSLWAGSVCFCSFLRGEEKNNCFDLQQVT